MASGDGGFSTAVGGFNKNEVNEYISKMSKEKQRLEAELKSGEDKIKSLQKVVDDSERRIQAAKDECEKQVADLNAQIKNERKKSEELVNQVDDLKRKLKNGGAKGAAVDSNADKRAEEIINAANEKARQIIANAEKTAAAKTAGVSTKSVDTGALMALLSGFQATVSNELKKLSAKASEVLNTPVANIAVSTPAKSDNSMSMDDGFFANMDSEQETATSDDMGGFGDMGGFDDVQTADVAADLTDTADTSLDMTAENAEDMNVAPLDDPEIPRNEMDEDFGKDLLAQTMPSSALSDAMQDILNGYDDSAIKGSDDSVDFDMGGSGDNDDSSGMSDIDAMNALLGQMSARLENAGGNPETADEPKEPASSSDDNPWADLQAQLNAMENSGNYGGDSSDSETGSETITDVPQAPSADDSSIWNFGMDSSDSSNNDDDDMSDDMSADLFGSF